MELNLILLNAGSPMMWFGIVHLVFINAGIGAAESRLLTQFKAANKTWLVILANYVSLIAGLFIVAPFSAQKIGNWDFWGGQTSLGEYEMTGFFFGMLMAFLTTILLELPFFYLALREKDKRKDILGLTLKVNGITYTAMFLFYFIFGLAGSTWVD